MQTQVTVADPYKMRIGVAHSTIKSQKTTGKRKPKPKPKPSQIPDFPQSFSNFSPVKTHILLKLYGNFEHFEGNKLELAQILS